ncbi:MAG TPA: c-type cytochrome [Verrucomicrobiae bacterium]|nr:c-type cytochrome [Verrucomicrobiae bacterium]
MKSSKKLAVALALAGFCILQPGSALDIHLPPETGAFKQAPGAELANGQCLVCHSVDYVQMQPPMPRTFWNAEVTKMKAKYGAQFPDADIQPLVDYLTKNYGIATPGNEETAKPTTAPSTAAPVATTAGAIELATKYGCFGCHNTQMKIVGPAYRDIAAKYKNDPGAAAKIDEQIHKGGSGKWGPIIMPPFPQVTPAETKTLATWILSLK